MADHKEDADLLELCNDLGLVHKMLTEEMGIKTVSGLGDVVIIGLENDLTQVKNEFGVNTTVATNLIKHFNPTGNPTGEPCTSRVPAPLYPSCPSPCVFSDAVANLAALCVVLQSPQMIRGTLQRPVRITLLVIHRRSTLIIYVCWLLSRLLL